MNKNLIVFLFIFGFKNVIAQEEKISEYEYYKAPSTLVNKAEDADEILGYIYMDKTFTKVKKYSNYFKVISKRKDGSKIYDGKMNYGLWTGLWMYYYPNGNPIFKGDYLNGIIQNDFTVYYPSGNIREFANFNNGERVFSFKLNEKGDTVETKFYNNGILAFSKKYHDDRIDERIFKNSTNENFDIFIKNNQGKLLIAGHYFNKYAIGNWRFYNEKGDSINQILFTLKDSAKITEDMLFDDSSIDSISYRIFRGATKHENENRNNYKQVSLKFHYPTYSKEHNLEGKIFIGFDISETGEKEFIAPLNNGPQGELTNTAIRTVQYLNNFRRGQRNGKPIRTSFVLPQVFKLNTE